MPKATFTIKPTLGLITDTIPSNIPVGGAYAMSNINIVNDVMRQRAGYNLSALHGCTTKGSIKGIEEYVPLSGTGSVIFFVVSSSNKLLLLKKGLSSPFSIWTDITGSLDYALTTASDNYPMGVNFGSSFYGITGGTSALFKYNGTTTSVPSYGSDVTKSPPYGAKYIAASNTRLFMANHLTDYQSSSTRVPYRVSWSDYLDPTRWISGGSAGYQDLLDEADPVTGLCIMRGYVVAFKENFIYLGSPSKTLTYEFRKIASDVGCIAPRSITVYRDEVFFLSNEGQVFVLSGQQVMPIGEKIAPRIKEVMGISDITFTNVYASMAISLFNRHDLQYNLIVPNANNSVKLDTIFTYDIKSKSWTESVLFSGNTPPTGYGSSYPLCAKEITFGRSKELFFGTDSGCIMMYSSLYPYDTFTDTSGRNGFRSGLEGDIPDMVNSNILPVWESGVIDALTISNGQLEILSLDRISVEADSGFVKVSVACSDNMAGLSYANKGLMHLTHQNILSIRSTGRYFQIKLEYADYTYYSDKGELTPAIGKLHCTFMPSSGEGR